MTDTVKKKDQIGKIVLEIRELVCDNHTGKVEVVLDMKCGTIVNCSLKLTKRL